MYRLMSSGNVNERPERLQNPRINANIFEIISFSWLLNIFKTGKKRDLVESDLYATLDEHKSSILGDEIEKKWKTELVTSKKISRDPSLLRVLVQMFGVKFMLFGLIQALVEIVLKLSQPLFIGGLLEFFNSGESTAPDSGHAYTYAFCLVLNMFASIVLHQVTQSEMLHIGMAIRVACSSLIFKKAVRLSKNALGETTAGRVVNLLSNDVLRFDTAFISPHYLWISPIQTMVATYFIWQIIGVSSLVGLAACFLFIPLQGWLGKKTSEFRSKTAVVTDERIRLINEIITGIQVIKMYTWEKPFAYLAQCTRKKELHLIQRSSYIKATLVSFAAFHMRMTFFLCIAMYIFLGNSISAQKVFVITTYYHILQATLTTRFTHAIRQMAEMHISIKRIQCYLSHGEKDYQVKNHSKNLDPAITQLTTYSVNRTQASDANKICNDEDQSNNFRIIISNASAKWTDVCPKNSLRNVNLAVRLNELVAIIGPVGAGKSSLIQAILRELPLSEGKISVCGTVSYASQEPWLFSGSVRQNILFDSPMDYERYNQIVKICALEIDFKQLPYGDNTIVGERGVTLSGGQKSRINLARAIYKQADIYLLDDPLSAVDTHVGKQLFEKCIKGFLKDKTCLLITHQLQYLTRVDNIILMNKATILAKGAYKELRATNLDLKSFLQSSDEKKSFPIDKLDCKPKNITNDAKENSIAAYRRVSVKSIRSASFSESKDSEFTAVPIEIIETRCSGNVSNTVYSSYISAGGGICKIIFFIFICISTQVLASGGDLWITFWVNLEEHFFNNEHIGEEPPVYNGTSTIDVKFVRLTWWSISRWTCLAVFAFFTLITITAVAVRSITIVSLCTQASKHLHEKMFAAITRATMLFFNTNSSGCILNRFSKDMGAIDENILVALMDFVHYGSTLVGIVVIVGLVNVYLLIPTIILAFVFYKFTTFYLSTSRSIKRLDGITRSPMIAHLNTSLQGLTTIRAFKAEQIVCEEFDYYQDLHSSAWYLFITSSRAFGLWLDIFCLIYISIVAFSFIVISDSVQFGGNVGLAITQAFGLAGMLQLGMRQSAELENNMTSVERILEYAEVPQEPDFESPPDKKPPAQWPLNGQITFQNFYLRYSLDAPFVLKDVNVEITPMQKVGIVGRTGAGKSSLIGALFRLAFSHGKVIIDGIEIHDLGLHELRSRLSIIPQEPVLFSGTIRKNLDPFDEYSDSTLWDALDEVRLKNVIADGLNSKTSEGGSNFSVGQRQLLCLARAIVRNNKILVLDEATANIDQQTDAMIQNTIRNKFRSCTVLTIAHRLNTVMDSDKVLVLDAGSVVEFDHPHILLRNKNGYLYKMAEQTGKATLDILRSLAEETYKVKNMTAKS